MDAVRSKWDSLVPKSINDPEGLVEAAGNVSKEETVIGQDRREALFEVLVEAEDEREQVRGMLQGEGRGE